MVDDVRIFLDSNVILSGLLSSKGSPRILLDLLSLGVPLFKGMTGQYNVDEVERNLNRRFPEIWTVYREFFPKIRLEIVEVAPYEEIKLLLEKMSPKDAPVLASARLGKANYLITGNKKDFPKEIAKPILIVTPGEFLEKVLPALISKDSGD